MWQVLKQKYGTAYSENDQLSAFREFTNLRPLDIQKTVNNYIRRTLECKAQLQGTWL